MTINTNNDEIIDDFLTNEVRKLVGYVMPVLEAEKVSITSKSNIKKILWNHKENLKAKLIEKSNNDGSNKE